ncbi:MAG: hypothetical protein M3356_03015 [Actinomycetota bacterium]|nr:hypothetical protein [Actinomycetota bacterium]
MSDEPRDVSPEAERRLGEHLELLRSDPSRPGAGLARRVVRTARWQRAARAPLRVVGMIAGSLLDGIMRLVAPGERKGG